MARKLCTRQILPVALLMLLVACGSGCASRGKVKTTSSEMTTVTPSRLPAASSIASDSSRLSGVQAGAVSTTVPSSNASSGSTVDELYSPSVSRSNYSSSGEGCSTGSCGKCRG